MAAAKDDALEALIGRIPTRPPTTVETTAEKQSLHCCCGHADCPYLKHNCNALADLEKEVHTAAALGQVSHIPIVPQGFMAEDVSTQYICSPVGLAGMLDLLRIF